MLRCCLNRLGSSHKVGVDIWRRLFDGSRLRTLRRFVGLRFRFGLHLIGVREFNRIHIRPGLSREVDGTANRLSLDRLGSWRGDLSRFAKNDRVERACHQQQVADDTDKKSELYRPADFSIIDQAEAIDAQSQRDGEPKQACPKPWTLQKGHEAAK